MKKDQHGESVVSKMENRDRRLKTGTSATRLLTHPDFQSSRFTYGESGVKDFAEWLKREKRNCEGTIKIKLKAMKRLRKHVNLWDNEAVEAYIQDSGWSSGYKNLVLQAYKDWVNFHGFDYEFQLYKRDPKLPSVPLEKEVDQLIGGFAYSIYGPFLQLLKESGCRPVEAWRLTPQDFDLEKQIVTLNDPAKGSLPRQLKMSDKLTAMITPLIRKTPSNRRIWKAKLDTIRYNIRRKRRQIAEKLGNPKINRISLKTLRHFKGTMEYHKTKDILHVKEVLGHKCITSTMVYTHLVNWESDEWMSKVAQTVEEACQLVEAGFEYVTEMNGVKIFRKRK